MEKTKHLLWKIFISTFYLSAFTFGGGYVIVTLMKKKFVDEYHWIEEDEILDLIAIAQSSPGAIAVNGAIILGYRLAGIPGSLVAILGTILPPFIILSIVSYFYVQFRSNAIVGHVLEGMQAAVAAIIADVVIDMGSGIIKQKSILSISIMVLAFIASYFLEINVMLIIGVCIIIGILRAIFTINREEQS